MNKLKNSFLLFVALATVGITLMSHTQILKPKAEWEPSGCYKPNITVKYDCEAAELEFSSTTNCTDARYFEGTHIFNLNPNDYIQSAYIATECPGNDSFCCATILTDQTWWGGMHPPCLDQPYFTVEGIYSQFEIDQVYCKWDW